MKNSENYYPIQTVYSFPSDLINSENTYQDKFSPAKIEIKSLLLKIINFIDNLKTNTK